MTRTSLVALLSLSCVVLPALADLRDGEDSALRRNGEVSRRVWTPELTQGKGVSLGLALGLRGPVRQQLDRPVAPALTFDLGGKSSVSLIGAPGRGAMLVLQTPAW